MIQPSELKLHLQVELTNAVFSTTTKVWEILLASCNGQLNEIKIMADECPELLYAQYNYAPPIHFAVAEGHTDLVEYLLNKGAHDSSYRIYPFQESLQTLAADREYHEIVLLLDQYETEPGRHRFSGDNGRIEYNRSPLQRQFEKLVDENNLSATEKLLQRNPELALDETYFWSEGILTMPAKENHRAMIDLLMSYGAKVPAILKWAQYYYFERYDAASYLMENGMSAGVKSWQNVTVLHDMAQKGFIDKAALLIKHGAFIDAVDDLYLSTPLGLAARWGHTRMVEYLLMQGADPNKAGASWARPLAWANAKKHRQVEKLLLSAGAK